MMRHFLILPLPRLALFTCLLATLAARADFTGTPVTLQQDGGWCWFQDPRALIVNGHVVFGTVAGTTLSGISTGGDEKITDYTIASGATSTFTLKAAYNQDDHASPALAVLPDNRVLVTYNSHGNDNFLFWRVSAAPGSGISWGAEQQSTVNVNSDGNGNTYSNPFYLSVPNTVYNFSRALGYDTNYSKISGISATNNSALTNAGNFAYGGHFQYYKNPNGGSLATGTGGAGRPYVKYASNGADRIWFATTEDSPQNFLNSLYAGYVQFNDSGAGTVYTSTGTSLGAIGTGTAPTGSANPPTNGGNQGPIVSGTGFCYQPTQFTPIVKANVSLNGYDLSSASPYGAGYVPWAGSMRLDDTGNPCVVFVVMRNVSGAYGNNLEYGYARLVSGVWKTSRVGYAGYGLYNGQNQYAGLIAVDAADVNKVYFSANVNPATGVALSAPDGNRHYQIFSGVTTDGGAAWSFTQLTNTSSDNIRPVIASGGGQQALLWMRGTYTTYLNYNTNIVGFVPTVAVPVINLTSPTGNPVTLTGTGARLRLTASVSESNYAGAFTTQWSLVSGPGAAVFADVSSLNTTVQFPQTGTYVLQLSASDGSQSSTSQLTVAVNSGATDSTLALWLKLNESAGSVAADSSGTGNAGTASNVVWQNAGGKIDGAAQFGAIGSTLTVPDSSNLDGVSAFTLSYWFKAAAIVDSAGLVSKRGGGTDNNAYTTFTKSDGLLYVDIDRTAANPNRFTSAAIFAPATWYHVAVVFDGSKAAAQRGSLYVNGGLDATGTVTSTTIQNSTAPLVLGNATGNTATFNGLIDDVRFYRRALAASEISALAKGVIAPGVSAGPAPTATSGVAAPLTGTVSANEGGPVTTAWTRLSGPGTVTFGNSSNPTTTANFSQAGAYGLRLSASNATASVADELTITVASNPNVYLDWINAKYPDTTDANVVGTAADPDCDAVRNGMEWALGLDPAKADAIQATSTLPGLPFPSWTTVAGTNYLSLQVRRPAGRLGVTYGAEASDDLKTWTPAVQVGAASPNPDGSETVVFRDTVTQSTASKRFIRLKITPQ